MSTNESQPVEILSFEGPVIRPHQHTPAGPADEWDLQAACLGADPEIFFPEQGGSTTEAKAICARCPVAVPCLTVALDTKQRYGIWGCLAERERWKLMKRGVTDDQLPAIVAAAQQRILDRLERLNASRRPAALYDTAADLEDDVDDDLDGSQDELEEPVPPVCRDCGQRAAGYPNGRCAKCFWARRSTLERSA